MVGQATDRPGTPRVATFVGATSRTPHWYASACWWPAASVVTVVPPVAVRVTPIRSLQGAGWDRVKDRNSQIRSCSSSAHSPDCRSVYENRFLAQMRVVIVGPSGNAPPLKGGCLQSDSCSRWVCELSGDHRGSPGRMSVVDREIGPRRRGRGSVRLAFGSHFLLEPTSLLDVYDDDNCTVYRSAPAGSSASWPGELWFVKGPLAAKASVAKRFPMRRWVAASGWSWSDSGSSAKSASPYSSRPSR